MSIVTSSIFSDAIAGNASIAVIRNAAGTNIILSFFIVNLPVLLSFGKDPPVSIFHSRICTQSDHIFLIVYQTFMTHLSLIFPPNFGNIAAGLW